MASVRRAAPLTTTRQRSVLGRLFRRKRRNRYRPDFRASTLFRELLRSSAPFASFQDAREEPEDDPLADIARYFRARETPKFFADPAGLAQSARRFAAERAGWRRSLIERIASDRDQGLAIYVREGPRLRKGFPWGGLDPGPGGDNLYRKRPHRFGFASRMALAVLSGDLDHSALEEMLVDWIDYAQSRDNRFAYDSSLAVVQRMLSCSWAWAFLGARRDPGVEELRLEGRLVTMVASDIRFLEPRLGRSVANNHLLADQFAGWFIGMIWPELCPSPGWAGRFEPLWLDELRRQILDDGTSFEHSTHYHEYACEMTAAYVLLKRRNQSDVPTWVHDRLARMLRFQIDLGGTDELPQIIGDAAEDPIFSLSGGDGWGCGAWRELYRALVSDDVDPADVDAASAEKAFWLLGGELRARVDQPSTAKAVAGCLRAYPHGGFYVFTGPEADTRLVFRTGPRAGEPVSAGHAHADLLGVYLTIEGTPVFVDGGTFTYRSTRARDSGGEPAWRSYFRGPRAHNALSIEGHDPLGNVDGDFRPLHASTHVHVSQALDGAGMTWVDGVIRGGVPYDGYRRGVVHVHGEYWIVYDALTPANESRRRSFGFQLTPDCTVETADDGARVAVGGVELRVAASPGLAPPRCYRGSREPLAGWVSKRYGHIEPSPQLRFDPSDRVKTSAFLLQPSGDRQARVEIAEISAGAVRVMVTASNVRDTLIVNVGERAENLEAGDGLWFRGRLAWIRSVGGRAAIVRWLDGESLDWPREGVSVRSTSFAPELDARRDRELTGPRSGDDEGLSVRWLP